MEKISLDKIKLGDYISKKELEEIVEQGESTSPDFIEAVRCILKIGFREKPKAVVFQQDGVYRILEGRGIVSAYAYLGKEEIPVEVLPPDHSDIPAFIRRNKW